MSEAAKTESRSERMLTAALWAAAIFAAVYLLQGALHLPGLLYDPAARRWLVDTSPSSVQMRYYSDVLGAGLSALLAAALRLRWRRAADDLTVLTGSALALVLLDLAFFFSRILTALRR